MVEANECAVTVCTLIRATICLTIHSCLIDYVELTASQQAPNLYSRGFCTLVLSLLGQKSHYDDRCRYANDRD